MHGQNHIKFTLLLLHVSYRYISGHTISDHTSFQEQTQNWVRNSTSTVNVVIGKRIHSHSSGDSLHWVTWNNR